MAKKRKELTPLEPVEPSIHEIRGERVMLDSDLARIYGVETKSLNRAVKRTAQFHVPTDACGVRNFEVPNWYFKHRTN